MKDFFEKEFFDAHYGRVPAWWVAIAIVGAATSFIGLIIFAVRG